MKSPNAFPDLDRLPGILAIPWAEMRHEDHPVMRLHRLCDMVEVLTRLLAIIALGEWRRAGMPDDLVKRLQGNILLPTFGKWWAVLRDLSRQYPPASTVSAEIPGFTAAHLRPRMQTPGVDDETMPWVNIIGLRNALVHSGGMTRARAKAFLVEWEPWVEGLLAPLNFLSACDLLYVTSPGAGLLLRGTGREVESAAPEQPPLNHVVLVRAGEWLDLWPLVDYGRAVAEQVNGPRTAIDPTTLVYFRAESDRLLYAALTGDVQLTARTDVLGVFRALFRLEDRRPDQPPENYDDEFEHDAGLLRGRVAEIAQAKTAIKETQEGVLWIGGPGGMGKSFLMALLARDLPLDNPKSCRIAWRFDASDQRRGNRAAFLRYAYSTLAEWLSKHHGMAGIEPGDPDPRRLELQFTGLLATASTLIPSDPRDRAPRVLILLDGMDEIAHVDPKLSELPFEVVRSNVVWICSGREESGLEIIFDKSRCRHIFRGGLPGMGKGDVRALLLEGLSRLKFEVVARDQEASGTVQNPVVDAILERAEGLPLYVRLLVDDLRDGEIRIEQLPAGLPPSLSAYFDRLLDRLKIGDLQALLTPLVFTLAWAKEPLDEDTLALLLERRTVIRRGEEGRRLLCRGLAAMQAMVRPAGGGYKLYHSPFQDHIRSGGNHTQNQWARDFYAALARDWKISRYALRFGPQHLVDEGKWEMLRDLLTDLRFVEARCAAGMTFDLVKDYALALEALPEVEEEVAEERRRLERMEQYTRSLISFAMGAIEKLAIPSSAEPLSEERIEAEITRITLKPTPLDRVRAFAQFVGGESYPLQEFGGRPGLVVQHAWNDAPEGPVHESADAMMPKVGVPLLARRWRSGDRYNPKPALRKTLEGHENLVRSVSITPDGRRAVSGSEDKTLRVWDLESGTCLWVLDGHANWVHSVSVTPDGRRAVSGSSDKTLRVWDLESGTCLGVLDGHTDSVTSVCVTADGRRAVSGSGDKTSRLWDLETGTCLQVLEGHTDSITSVCVTPDGRRAVSGSSDKTLRVWDLESGTCLRVLEGHTGWVKSVGLTPDGWRAVSGGLDNTLRVWELETGTCLRVLEGHTHFVESVSLTPDGRRAVSGSSDYSLRVWDLETGACVRVLEGHTGWVKSVSITPDGRRAASGSDDKTLRVWDLEMATCLRMLEGHSDSVTSVSVPPDGRCAVSGSSDKILRLWDLESGACLRALEGHTGGIDSVGMTPDGWRAVSGSSDNTMRVWDLQSGMCLRVFEGHNDRINSLSVTHDGRHVVSASWDETLRVWDLETGTCLCVLEGHTGRVESVTVTLDRCRVVSGSSDHTLRVWDLETGTCLRVFEGHTDSVYSVSVTADGRRAISGSRDHTLRVWDLETGTCRRVLEGHTDAIISVSVTADGRRVVSGGLDNSLRVWSLETGVCEVVVRLGAGVVAVACSPTLGLVIAGTFTGQLLSFSCDLLLPSTYS